ncbi:MAG: cytochrome c [SAR202 cluster bacterium]|nr:cytochrome c [SAR202 cluster bacterium]
MYRTIGLLALVVSLAAVLAACGGSPTAAPTRPAAPATPTGSTGDPVRGKTVATQNGCLACHSTTGAAGVGPTWKGLHGSTVQLAGGGTATVDDAYIREAIVEPNAKVRQGFQPNIMPGGFGDTLTGQDIADITAYIAWLH